MKLNVIIELDDSGYYVAEVPAMPGCVSQGRTLEERKQNIREAIEGWILVMKAERRKDYVHLTNKYGGLAYDLRRTY